MMQANKRKMRLQLVSLFLVFTVPALMGWILYHYHDHFQFKTINHGVLVNPPLHVQELVASDRTWQIAYITSNCSDKQSEKMMYTLHQVQKALGKDRDRVSLTFVENKACAFKATQPFRQLLFTDVQYNQLQKASFQKGSQIYLVDPIGNVFMYYPITTNPMDILKDLKYVLGVSQIG